jgi:endoglucanase
MARLSGLLSTVLAGLLVFILGLTASGCSVLFPSSPSAEPTDGAATTALTGCTAGPPAPVPPGGYYVNGNTICTAAGETHLFHGLDRPSMEWRSDGQNLSAADFALMASWKANVVRIALNQDFWIAESPLYSANYASLVDRVIGWAEGAGMDVILDLHWSDAGVLGSCAPSAGCQQKMADANSLTFWSQVAARYANDGRVLFELYNEPHDVSWSVWKSGGDSGSGWHVVGMQQLYDAVRTAGANNLVVIGGLDFAYDLSEVPGNRIAGYNILYATHTYNNSSEKAPSSFGLYWGNLTKTDPVIVTEFGDFGTACSPKYNADVVKYADAHFASWTAWAWYPGGCGFPSLITDWMGTASAAGAVIKAALAGYPAPPTLPAADAATSDATIPGSDAIANAGDAGLSASDADSQ